MKRELAVNTPRGKKFLDIQHKILKRICLSYNMKLLNMNKDNARIDGILGTSDNKGVCVFEFKSRSKDIEYFKKNGIFISNSKIKIGCEYSKLFGVPLVFYFYLYEQDEVYSILISDDKGRVISDIAKPVYMNTQYNCNKEGVKKDLVSYLPLKEFKKLKI